MKSGFGPAFGLAKTLKSLLCRRLHLVEGTCNDVVFVGSLRARTFTYKNQSPAGDTDFAKFCVARIQLESAQQSNLLLEMHALS